jgi:hypothetical protein
LCLETALAHCCLASAGLSPSILHCPSPWQNLDPALALQKDVQESPKWRKNRDNSEDEEEATSVKKDKRTFDWHGTLATAFGKPGCQYSLHSSTGADATIDGSNYLLKGTDVYTTVQFRLDGKNHARKWSRFPALGVFADWERAKSFGFSAKWKDPAGKLYQEGFDV